MTATAGIADTAAPVRNRPLGRLLERLTAADPAFSRLRLASRALLSVLLTAAVLAGLTTVHPLPIAAYGLAVVIAFTGAMAVRDNGGRAQMLTRLFGLAASLVLVFVSGVLANWPVVADLAFLAVIFGAVYVRTYGQRWFTVGLIGFMSYFMGDYLRPEPGDIGWLAAAAVIAFAITHLVTVYILPDNPERDFRRALLTLDRRINVILRQLLEAAGRHAAAAAERAPLQAQLSELRETVLMAEGFIPQGEDGALAAAGAASDLAVALFDLQLVVERMVRASYIALPPEATLRAVLGRKLSPVQVTVAATAATNDRDISASLLLRLVQARTQLDAALGPRPSAAFAASKKPPPGPSAANSTAAGPGPLVPVSLQLPIQVTLACAIAMGCGLLLSPVRWYWAVLTAFIVFNNAKSRADTAVRALQRSAGTFAGLIGGTLLATLLHGQLIVSAAAIPLLFFLAFYFLQASYSVMIFFVTLALALLYGIMGSFTPELLVVRLEETVVGSIAGSLVAFLVFPARASLNAGAALDKYLRALGELVAAAGRRAHGEAEPQHLLARSRLLDRAYTELAAAVRPLGGPWGAVTRFGEVRERLLLLTGCAHWGRVLARSLRPGETLPEANIQRIEALAKDVQDRIAAAEELRDSFFERPKIGDGIVTAATPRPPVPISAEEDPAFALAVISALLDRATLAPKARRRLGLTLR